MMSQRAIIKVWIPSSQKAILLSWLFCPSRGPRAKLFLHAFLASFSLFHMLQFLRLWKLLHTFSYENTSRSKWRTNTVKKYSGVWSNYSWADIAGDNTWSFQGKASWKHNQTSAGMLWIYFLAVKQLMHELMLPQKCIQSKIRHQIDSYMFSCMTFQKSLFKKDLTFQKVRIVSWDHLEHLTNLVWLSYTLSWCCSQKKKTFPS